MASPGACRYANNCQIRYFDVYQGIDTILFLRSHYHNSPIPMIRILSIAKLTYALAVTLMFVAGGMSVAEAATAPNLVTNGSFEDGLTNAPTGWSQGGWGNNVPTYTYPVVGTNNTKGAEVRLTSRTDGDAKWVFNHVAVTAGQTYTYTDTYQATVPTSIVAEYKHTDGALEYIWFGDATSATVWTTFTKQFTVPADVVSVSVFHILAGVGTLTLDEVYLTANTSTPPPPTPAGKAMVSITFDDAWKTQYTKALPILTKYNMKGTFYITTQYFNTSLYSGFMTRAQVKDLYVKGHEIGGHTVSHPNLTTVSLTKLRAELKNSKTTLDTLLGKPIKGIAYPFGEYNQTVIDEAKKIGYTNGRTVEGGFNTKTTDPFRLYAISPSFTTPIAEIKTAIDEAKRDGTWLAIAFHEIDTNGREYSNSPAYFEEVLKYLKESQVEVVTVEQGLAKR